MFWYPNSRSFEIEDTKLFWISREKRGNNFPRDSERLETWVQEDIPTVLFCPNGFYSERFFPGRYSTIYVPTFCCCCQNVKTPNSLLRLHLLHFLHMWSFFVSIISSLIINLVTLGVIRFSFFCYGPPKDAPNFPSRKASLLTYRKAGSCEEVGRGFEIGQFLHNLS